MSSLSTNHDAVVAASSSSETPGSGWSNGELPPSMYGNTREGRVSLYASHRRWINLQQGWTRIGQGTTELDARHSSSQAGQTLVESSNQEAQTVRSLIAQLCETFYHKNWATGTGGGVTIRVGGPSEQRPWRVFVAPSGIQKEDMIGDDVFELDMDRNVVVPPKTPNLRQSACTPLWYVVYRHRPSAKCVIHTHSLHAQMATLLDPTETSTTLKITHLEMLKGVGNHAYDDVLEIPIIDNRPSEDLLADQLEQAIVNYPKCNAVLVRRHGIYVWGDSWEQAKTQCESFDYLLESAVRMRQMGLDPSRLPTAGTYRDTLDNDNDVNVKGVKEVNDNGKRNNHTSNGQPFTKRHHNDVELAGFHGMGQVDNEQDLQSNIIPIFPRQGKIVLLDIEGCTTSISFVKETLFPYVLEHLDDFLAESKNSTLDDALSMQLASDLLLLPDTHPLRLEQATLSSSSSSSWTANKELVKSIVRALMELDIKGTGLKALQGKMWKHGYEQGKLQGHVYDDFVPFLQWCQSQDISVHIYSSGSVEAQKLLFGKSIAGDLTVYLDQYFDTTSGSKKEATSYQTIAKALGVSPSEICFVSDAEAELVAAQQAGIGHVIMSIRPGNVPLTKVGKPFPAIHSLLQLCGK